MHKDIPYVPASMIQQPTVVRSRTADEAQVVVLLVDEDIFPENKYGQVACSFWLQFMAVGTINIYGVYSEAYAGLPMLAGQTTVTLAFIGSASAGSLALYGTAVGALADRYGCKVVACVGSALFTVSFVLASFATQYWHLLLTQGCLFGLSASLMFFPAIGIISHWFSKKRGLAIGIAASGSGFGGLILGPVTRMLISNIGISHTLLATGIFGGASAFFCSLLLHSRLAPSKKGSFNYSHILRDTRFIRFFLAGTFDAFGYFIPFFFTSIYAVQQGLSAAQGALLIGLLNGATAVGRVSLGILGDRYGHTLMLTTCLYVAALSVLFIWTFAKSFGVLLLFVLIFGFSAGGYISLIPTTAVSLFGNRNMATITGMIYTGNFPGYLFGSPLAAYMLDSFRDKTTRVVDFVPAIMLSGTALFVGASFMLSILPGEFKKTAEHKSSELNPAEIN